MIKSDSLMPHPMKTGPKGSAAQCPSTRHQTPLEAPSHFPRQLDMLLMLAHKDPVRVIDKSRRTCLQFHHKEDKVAKSYKKQIARVKNTNNSCTRQSFSF